MKHLCKSILSLCLVFVLVGTLLPAKAEALDPDFVVTGYSADVAKIKTGKTADITVSLRSISPIPPTSAVEAVFISNDSFSTGSALAPSTSDYSNYTVSFEDVKYTGVGNTLDFALVIDGTKILRSVTITNCVVYVASEPDPGYDSSTPEPRAVFSIAPPSEPIAAGQKFNAQVTVYNVGSTAMTSPILTVTPSEGLMLTGGTSAIILDSISAHKSITASVPLQALSSISAQDQYLECSLSFTYNSTNGTSSGKVTIPALTSEASDTTGTKPVPRIILVGYDYGGSIEAGKKQTVSFTFRNTSKSVAIENILLTVAAGGDLSISGSTNTFYFDSLEAGGSRGVSIPLKAASVLNSTAQDVRLSFEFEYAESGVRKSGNADLTISVPLFQPDRFTLAEPKVANIGFVGDQNTVTLDYVNKGKNYIYNLEAYISGDIDTTTPSVRVGNVEAGKSGTIAFAVAPYNEGANPVTITVSYEDSNGETKEQIFETSVEAMTFEPYDPGEWEEPIEEPTSSFPWWIIGVLCAIATIVIGIILSKKKKKAKLAAEAAMWDEWDDDKPAAPAEEKKEPVTAAVEEKKK